MKCNIKYKLKANYALRFIMKSVYLIDSFCVILFEWNENKQFIFQKRQFGAIDCRIKRK